MWLQSEENEFNCGKMMLLASNKAEIVRYKFEVLQGTWLLPGLWYNEHEKSTADKRSALVGDFYNIIETVTWPSGGFCFLQWL